MKKISYIKALVLTFVLTAPTTSLAQVTYLGSIFNANNPIVEFQLLTALPANGVPNACGPNEHALCEAWAPFACTQGVSGVGSNPANTECEVRFGEQADPIIKQIYWSQGNLFIRCNAACF